MNKIICALAVSGLFFAGLWEPLTVRAEKSNPSMSGGELLRAHNVPEGPNALSRFIAEAVRVSYFVDPSNQLPGSFERKVSVVSDGSAFKRYRVDPLGLREQIDLFDGTASFRRVVEQGKVVEERLAGDSQFKDIEFRVKTFGLIPILKQLADPMTEVDSVGRTRHLLETFRVRTATDNWVLYVDQRHLIRRVEIRGKVIEYGDYRSVGGTWLPFIQRVLIGGRQSYDLIFTRMDLNVTLPTKYFSREGL